MKKIKWGVLGTAGIAHNCTIPGMQLAENCELYAIAGRSMKKAEEFQKEFGFQKAYDSYDALLADPEIQAVYIPLPNDLHYEWTLKALKAKKNVLCEKPLAPSVSQIEEMISAAQENGVFLMEAFAYLHSPLITEIKSELKNGTIGKPVYIESAFLTSDYDTSNIRMRRENYGGSVYDLGCYNTSIILWLLDEDPVKVQAIAEYYPDGGVDNVAAGILSFADGTKATFNCAMALANQKNHRWDRLYIAGTEGSIRCFAEFNQHGDLNYSICVDGKETVRTVPVRQNYALEVEQMGRCIMDGETPYVSNAFTIRNAKTLGRILESMQY